MTHSRFMWIEFQKPEEADATEMILEPDSGEDQPVTSQSGVLTVRSDGAPGGLSSFLPSFPLHFLPLHSASFFNGSIRSTNIRGGGGALDFVPGAGIQRQETHHLPSRSSRSSWGAGPRGPGFLDGGDSLAGRGQHGAWAELECSRTS